MAFNPYLRKTEDELLAIESKIVDEIATGSQLQSASAGDVQSSRIVQRGPHARLVDVRLALFRINPDEYPLSEVPPTRSVAVMGSAI